MVNKSKNISSGSEIEKYFQKEKSKIINQLKFAKKNVPFYKQKLKNINLKNIKTYSNFHKLIPIIKQEEIIKNPQLFCSNKKIFFERHSSNTSGKFKKIFLTKKDLENWIDHTRLTITPYYKSGMLVAHSKRKEKY